MRAFILLLTLSLLPLSAIAESTTSIEITPLVGFRFGGDFDTQDPVTADPLASIGLVDEVSYGLIAAWDFDNKRQGEFLISHYNTDFSGNSESLPDNKEVGVTYMHLGGNVPISDGPLPFWASGGLGLTSLSPKDKNLDDERRFSINLGVHTRFDFSENLSLRLGGRVYATFFNSNSAIFCDTDLCSIYISSEIWVQTELNAGLTFSF